VPAATDEELPCNGERGVALQTPWNTREFGLRDPDGNGLIFYRDL
jgi:hypothetical protein